MIKYISYLSMEHGLAGTHRIDDALAKAKAASFDSLELCIGLEGVLHTQTTKGECEAIRAAIDESGLFVDTLASGMSWALNPISDDPEIRQKAIDMHTASLERAKWLGCEAVSELLETADRLDVDLCLENVRNGLFYSPFEWIAFIVRFDSDRLGMYFDVGNVLGYHQDPAHWIEMLGSRIKRVHIKDFLHEFDWNGKYSFCDLGKGDLPAEQVFSALRKVGYDSTIVAEMLPYTEGRLEKTSQTLDQWMGNCVGVATSDES